MSVHSDRATWRHPISISLLNKHGNEMDMLRVLDLEVEALLAKIKRSSPQFFSSGEIFTPIEKIARTLNIDLTTSKHLRALGTTKHKGTKYQVTINTKSQHYFRQRFTIAHEMGHICLNQLAGPFTFHELAQTKDTHFEEEYLCDLFASSILMPKSVIKQYLEDERSISLKTVNQIASDFKVSKSAVLRRIACVTGSLLLFWSEVENPLTEGSEKAERITSIYPNLHQLSKYYIPLYCTASNHRFSPNLIAECLETQSSISGVVKITGLGSLPSGDYKTHCIFFNRWARNAISPNDIRGSQRLCDIATLIELKEYVPLIQSKFVD
jgi:Zn-dependent peptidase ImmA (M78 family)